MIHFCHVDGVSVNLERLSAAQRRISSSAIRDLLEVAERPDVISMAGGLPAAEAFPAEVLARALAEVVLADPARTLQYSTSRGVETLRTWVAAQRPSTTADDVVITAGSQQALDLVARTLLDQGDTVALADPGYVGAIQAFRLTGAELVGIPSDGDGMQVDVLAERLASRAMAVPSLVYVVSNFSNPGGATLSLDRRRRLAELADHHGFVVVDDDPYAELRWAGSRALALAELSDRVVTLGSFSKVLSPGLRVGYAAGPAWIVEAVVLLKQAADLHTSTLAQHAAAFVVADETFWSAHLARLRTLYEERATALVGALRARLGHRVELTEPEGGLFVWARLPGVDTSALLAPALARGVAFVPGAAFAVADGAHADGARLSFATATPDRLDEGVARLAAALDGEVRLSSAE